LRRLVFGPCARCLRWLSEECLLNDLFSHSISDCRCLTAGVVAVV
jgi:hypothetical protein